MRYRDSITPDGVLDDAMALKGRRVGGVPGFLYREWLVHAGRYAGKICLGRIDAAFFDECRLRYLTSYIVERWSGEPPSSIAKASRITRDCSSGTSR